MTGITVREPLAGLFGLVRPAVHTATAGHGGDVRKVLTVERRIQRVFPVFANYTTWPRVLPRLRQVEDLGFGLSHWRIAGPVGLSVHWLARLTRFIPNELIAWRSEPGSTLPNSGSIRFEPAGAGSTRVLLRVGYDVPAGSLGRFAAWLFGCDPDEVLDEALAGLRCLIEEAPA
jgi:uncharacterized membrane protein